jgi:hypothetical protein
MRSIKAFYRLSSLANNNPGVVATFGEIETQSLTFTTEDRNYKYSTYPNTELVTLQVVDDLQQPVVTTEALMRRITAVGEWLYEQHIKGTIPADALREQIYASLRVEFADLQWISVGELVRSAENSFFMPTYVEFIATDSSYEYHVKVWLSNKKLQEEYEPYTLYIIPPVDNLNQFINNTVTVAGILSGFTPKKMLQKYNAIRKDNPETRLDMFDLTWHDPEDSSSRIETSWGYIAYGVGATNLDNIKTGIRDYLAGNSQYEDWPSVFPSLYEENDFTLVPLWDNISVRETQVDQNLYASYSSIKELTAIAKRSTPTSYGTAASIEKHIAENLEIFSTFYRGMMFISIGNPSNLNRLVKLSTLYPDYSSVPVSSDFERMEEATRTFAERLAICLEAARTYREGDTVPSGYYRLNRNSKTYIAFLFNNYQYMVMTRDSYMTYSIKDVN